MFKLLKNIIKDFDKPVSVQETIEDIHNQFNRSGEALLKETKEYLASMEYDKADKAALLSSCGFTATAEAKEYANFGNNKAIREKLVAALEYFYVNFPQYKFITKDMADSICQKYNLVIGSTGRYKGFVPEKNLKEIAAFFDSENELSMKYHTCDYHGRCLTISKKDYDKYVQQERERNEMYSNIGKIRPTTEYYNSYHSEKNALLIAAPIKDMNKTNSIKTGNWLMEIPDPVVLAPIIHDNITLYCIVTAWGDEASDETIVNQLNN